MTLAVTLETLPDDAPPADALAVMRFAAGRAAPRVFPTGVAALGGDRRAEVWRVAGPVAAGEEGDIAWARGGGLLFGALVLDEDGGDLAAPAQDAYARILAFLRAAGHPAILRAWNYFPRIHARDGGLDRYQSFCIGRHRAFAAADYGEALLPAATLIGTAQPGLRIAFLAAEREGAQVENPRQVSAFRYPPAYGPQSPSFSRATLKDGRLFVSGTASIVGHESRHGGDALAQCDEILANLDAVVAATRDLAPLAARGPADLAPLRVYLRDPRDLPAVRARLEAALGSRTETIFLHGDICRKELRIEIEGLA